MVANSIKIKKYIKNNINTVLYSKKNSNYYTFKFKTKHNTCLQYNVTAILFKFPILMLFIIISFHIYGKKQELISCIRLIIYSHSNVQF